MLQHPDHIPFGKLTAEILIGTKPSSPQFPIRVLGIEVDSELQRKTEETRRQLEAMGFRKPIIDMALSWALERTRWQAEEAYRDMPEDVIRKGFASLYDLYLRRAISWAEGLRRAGLASPFSARTQLRTV